MATHYVKVISDRYYKNGILDSLHHLMTLEVPKMS